MTKAAPTLSFVFFIIGCALFADELFQLQFIFKAQNPEMIEPSDLTLIMRPISWFILVVMVFATYMMGLI